MKRPYRLNVARIVTTYALAALVWIVASDYVADFIFPHPGLHTYKGVFFVFTTAMLLYVLLRRAANEIARSEEDILSSRERFRQVVEYAPEAIFIQTGGVFQYVNPSMLRLLGAENASRVVGTPVLDWIPPEDRDAVQERVATVARGLPAASREQQFLRLDGSRVDVEASAVPFNFTGQAGALVFARDISSRKAAANEKRQLEAQVQQAQKMESIGRLAGGVAHDFNNLLTIINGYCDMMLSDIAEDDEMRESLTEVRDAGERAASLTRQLLSFSRRDQSQPTVLNVDQVVHELEKMLRRLVGENIVLTTHTDGSCGPVFIDPTRFNQVLMNLVVNSRDAMPEGGGIDIYTASVEVGPGAGIAGSGDRSGSFVRLRVTDTGCGMPPEVLTRIFEPFFTTKPLSQGTGLGLSTAYGIVNSAGGWISAASEPRCGTTLDVFLPVHQGAGIPAIAATDSPREDRGTETILLVEDDDHVRRATEAMLTQRGYRVLSAGGAETALELARQHRGDIRLVLSDVVMPHLNGPQLVRKMQQEGTTAKVLLMSGYRPEETNGGQADMEWPSISKPFSPAGLARQVRSVLDRE